MIDVQAGAISFRFCGEMMDFCFPLPTPSSMLVNLPHPVTPVPTVTPNAASEVELFDGDGGPHVRSIGFSNFSAAIPSSFGGTVAHSWEVVTASPFTTFTTHLPLSYYHLPI